MDALRRSLVCAAVAYNIPVAKALVEKWPTILNERNMWGETPLEEYQRLGWQSVTVIAILKQPQ
jgi:hypothetical protein